MKIKSLSLQNFRKISNIPTTTITFHEDINVLVGANNTGKTSILFAIQKLFNSNQITEKDLNYVVKNGELKIEGIVQFTKEDLKPFFELLEQRHNDKNILQNLHKEIEILNINELTFSQKINFLNKKIASNTSKKGFLIDVLSNKNLNVNHFNSLITHTNFYTIFKSPLYLDSRGNLMEKEKFVPLNEIENQFQNQNQPTNIRGLLYALKKKDNPKFQEFKQRLLAVFMELEDVDVTHNEDIGEFELILTEKMRNNGSTENVMYDIKDVGQGMQSLVLMLATVLLLKPHIVLMDEPEAHMHPSLIGDFVKYLKHLSQDTQFIITSHSLVLMQAVGMDKIFHLKNDVEQKGVIIQNIAQKNDFLDTIKEIGYDIDTLSYIAKPAVYLFVEGKSDKKYILSFAKKANLHKKINVFNVGFIIMGGKDDRYKFSNFIHKLQSEFFEKIPFTILLDKDEITNEEIENFKNKFPNNPDAVFYLKKRQIENYLINAQNIKNIALSKIKDVPEKQKFEKIDVEAKILELCETQKDSIFNNFMNKTFADAVIIPQKKLHTIFSELKKKDIKTAANDFVAEFAGELTKIMFKKSILLSQETISTEEFFEQEWQTNKLDICDGKELWRNIKTWLQDFKISINDDELIENLQIIPIDIQNLLNILEKKIL